MLQAVDHVELGVQPYELSLVMQVGGFDDVPTTTSDNIALGTLYYLSPKMSCAFASHCSHNLAHVHRTDLILASDLMRSYKEGVRRLSGSCLAAAHQNDGADGNHGKGQKLTLHIQPTASAH